MTSSGKTSSHNKEQPPRMVLPPNRVSMKLAMRGGFYLFIQSAAFHTERTTQHSRKGHLMNARHSKKINARRLTLILTLSGVLGLVLWAIVYSIVNPSPHAPQSHAQPTASAPAPTHAKPAPTHTAPSPACTAPAKPKPPAQGVSPVKAHPLPVRYTVKLGDNLSTIAAHFHLRSYVPLYHANTAAIGNNPNVIHVGLHLTVPKG
jgi:hypothetical protein